MAQEKAKQIITQLKKLKEEKELSISEIMDTLEKTNNHLSKATVLKIFSDGSEEYGYQYDTIRTLADAMFGVYSSEDSDNAEIQGLKDTVQLQNILIDQLRVQLEEAQTSALRRIDFLRDRVEKQDIRIEQKDRLITILLMMHLLGSDKIGDNISKVLRRYFADTLDEIGDWVTKDNPDHE